MEILDTPWGKPAELLPSSEFQSHTLVSLMLMLSEFFKLSLIDPMSWLVGRLVGSVVSLAFLASFRLLLFLSSSFI